MKERQNHEESKMLWKLELESAERLTLTEEHKKLIDIVTNKIDDYSLTYEEYVTDIMECLDKSSDEDDPKVVVSNMINQLIEKYGK